MTQAIRTSISIHFARAAINAARRTGLDPAPLLAAARLHEGLLAEKQIRITPEQLAKLIMAVRRAVDDELMGLAASAMRAGLFSLMAHQAFHGRDLISVYGRAARAYDTLTDALTLRLNQHQGEARLTLVLKEPELDPDHLLSDFILLIWHRFPSWLVGRPIPLRAIHLAYPQPPHSDEYRLMFPCPALFDAPSTCLVFDADHLSLPLIQPADALDEYLRSVPREWFTRMAFGASLTERVTEALGAHEHGAPPSMAEVAAMLSMTTRTLRRQLGAEGARFQALKDLVRRDRAIHALTAGMLSVAEIGYGLGFTEPAGFSRAFKSWIGVSPRAYRRQVR